jgi:hypothetical protein
MKNGSIEMSEDDEISALFPQPVEFKIGDKVLASLLPMNLDGCFTFAASLKPILGNLFEGGATMDGARFADILFAAAEHRAGVYDALSVATGRSAAFLARLPLGVAMTLTQVVFQVNVDFFVRAVGGLSFIPATVPTAKPEQNGDGRTS